MACVDCNETRIVGDGFECPTCTTATAERPFSGPILEAMNENADPAPKAVEGILANKHDVSTVQAEVEKLIAAINGHGVMLDISRLRASSEAYAAVQILVNKGICTEHEAQHAVFSTMRTLLQSVLQQTEEQQLQAAKPKVETVRAPLAVVRH